MTSILVKIADGSWKSGVLLDHEPKPILLNHIFFLDSASDYHYRVTGFFTGTDHWGRMCSMAEVESFRKRDTAAYLTRHGIAA